MKHKLIFITGGARSGKSRFALTLADAIEGRKVFLATAEALDEEMKSRIETHKKERPSGWVTIEEARDLSKALMTCNGQFEVILIDCLTVWVSNLLVNDTYDDSQILKDVNHLISGCRDMKGTVILVANEVGLGIVPANRLARFFRDTAGKVNQKIAAVADDVYLVVAGMSLKLKGGD